jgi:hypothetical protein
MLDAFAMIFGETPKEIAEQIGHQGKNGYHSQELIELALMKGYTVTPIERRPVNQSPKTYETVPVIFREGNDQRFGRHLSGHVGVLCGRNTFSAFPHAIAWTKGQAYDASIDKWFPVLNDAGVPDDIFFVPITFLRVDRCRTSRGTTSSI